MLTWGIQHPPRFSLIVHHRSSREHLSLEQIGRVQGVVGRLQSSYRKCISAILYRPQTREAAANAEIRAAKLLGVAQRAREFEAIATATPSSIGKLELRAFYNYAKSVRSHHMALAMIATLSAAFT